MRWILKSTTTIHYSVALNIFFLRNPHSINLSDVISMLYLQLSHGILLGVVGTDVALRELMRLAPRYKVNCDNYVVFFVMLIHF